MTDVAWKSSLPIGSVISASTEDGCEYPPWIARRSPRGLGLSGRRLCG